MKRIFCLLVLLVLHILCAHGRAAAHDGPPFPILEGIRAGPYQVQVWTDPDIGIGDFFVILEPHGAHEELPTPGTVLVTVQPVSRRLDPVSYTATRQPATRGQLFYAGVAFDAGEWWDVAIRIEWPGGAQTLTSRVEATPEGQIGPIGLVVFALPFLLVGLLWFKASRRRNRQRISDVS